jgi:hypothetical protein
VADYVLLKSPLLGRVPQNLSLEAQKMNSLSMLFIRGIPFYNIKLFLLIDISG